MIDPALPPLGKPIGDNLIANSPQRDVAVAIDEAFGLVTPADVGRPLGRANNGSVVQRSQNSRTVVSRGSRLSICSRAFSLARFASAFVLNVPAPPSTRDTLMFLLLAGS